MSTLIIPPTLTSPRDDATKLYKAFKGMGCDTASVINILAHRNSTQRALIQQEYMSMYSEDLNKRLSSELSGNLKKAMKLWILDPVTRDATIVNMALKGNPNQVDYKSACEIILTRTEAQIEQFRNVYFSLYNSSLASHIEGAMTGSIYKLLLEYLAHPRYDDLQVNQGLVMEDAKALFQAGEKRMGTDELVFITIFSQRCKTHLAAVSLAYYDLYGTSLKKAIKSETSGMFEFALLTILQCALNPAKYFVKALYKAMEGLGTNDATLIRIIVTRSEIDMQYIKALYREKYGKTLNDAVLSETSGGYRNFLFAVLGSNHK